MSNFRFNLLSFVYKLRDSFLAHKDILIDIGIKSGDNILDFGCGPGGFITAASELIGNNGRVYALDIQPKAIEKVQKIIKKNHLSNVSTLLSTGKIELNDESIDVILLFEVIHSLEELDEILRELYRKLKNNGILSVYDPTMNHNKLKSKMNEINLFEFYKRVNHRSDFRKKKN